MDRQTRTRLAATFALIALILGTTFRDPQPLHAQQDPDLLPRLGETTAEYEARMKGLPPPVRPAAPSSMTLAADPGGHFLIDVVINGSKVRMMVDTGASIVALSREDARRIGVTPQPADFKAKVSTANGIVQVAPVLLKEVVVGELAVQDVQAAVFPDNRLQVGLLGMSFLSKLSHFEVAGRQLILQR
jgi:aspartyl protease family protein